MNTDTTANQGEVFLTMETRGLRTVLNGLFGCGPRGYGKPERMLEARTRPIVKHPQRQKTRNSAPRLSDGTQCQPRGLAKPGAPQGTRHVSKSGSEGGPLAHFGVCFVPPQLEVKAFEHFFLWRSRGSGLVGVQSLCAHPVICASTEMRARVVSPFALSPLARGGQA